jgi:hypothetical protein
MDATETSKKDAVEQWKSMWFVICMSEVRAQPVLKSFTKTSPENSGGAENSAEISGTNGINFFCYMYESSLRHPVWVPEINVKVCNSVSLFFLSFNIIVSRVDELNKIERLPRLQQNVKAKLIESQSSRLKSSLQAAKPGDLIYVGTRISTSALRKSLSPITRKRLQALHPSE